MSYFFEFLQDPLKIKFLVVTFVLIIFIGLTIILLLQQRCLHQLRSISESLSYLNEGFVRTNLSLEATANRLQALEDQYSEFLVNYELSKVELTRLAEAIGGESRLTKAIDLARGGSNAQEIALATGLSEDEAKAIEKFHGPKNR